MDDTVIVLGADPRNPYLIQKLQTENYDARLLTEEWDDKAEKQISSCRAVVLPVNYSGTGKINGLPITAAEAADIMHPGGIMFSGKLSDQVKRRFEISGSSYVELMSDESFTLFNAHLTAEAAISLAVVNSKKSLIGSICTILGAGRIGTALIQYLSAFAGQIRVVARRESERERVDLMGCSAYDPGELSWALCGADYVFGTIPYPLVRSGHLKDLSDGYLYLELASAPYGFESNLCWPPNGEHLIASGLPGRVSPMAAGFAAAECVLKHLRGYDG